LSLLEKLDWTTTATSLEANPFEVLGIDPECVRLGTGVEWATGLPMSTFNLFLAKLSKDSFRCQQGNQFPIHNIPGAENAG
jgi:hypothetical protein